MCVINLERVFVYTLNSYKLSYVYTNTLSKFMTHTYTVLIF